MEKKRFIMPMFLALGVLMMIGLASASITINTPTSGLAVNGTYLFNITTDQLAVKNCTFSTASDGIFSIIANNTDDDAEFTTSNDTSVLTDAYLTTLTVSCANASAIQSSTRTFSIDNTNPVCSFSIPVGDDDIEYLSIGGVKPSDSSSDTTTFTYLWTLYDPNDNSQKTSTSSSPSFSGEDFDELGEFILSLTITDEVGKSTTCTNKTINVRGTDGTGQTIAISEADSSKLNIAVILVFGITFLVIIFVISIMIINKSKKSR